MEKERENSAVYQVSSEDNVATAIGDILEGPVRILGGAGGVITAREAIPFGFKIALCQIEKEGYVVKYGISIARASKRIMPGECVHSHNAVSLNDIRSSGFDLQTAVPADMRYTLPEESCPNLSEPVLVGEMEEMT